MKRRTETRVPRSAQSAVLAALLCLAASPIFAESRGTGATWLHRGDPGLSGKFEVDLPADLQPLWVVDVPDGIEATAAIVGDTVYAAGLNGKLYALDLASGKQRFVYEAGAEIKSSPTVYRGLVLFGDGDGTFHAVDAVTGKAKWTFKAGAEIASSANYSGDRIFFGSHDQHLYCLNVGDGSLIWKVETEGYLLGTAAIVGDTVVSAGCDGFLRVLRIADGSEVRRVEVGAYVGASPAYLAGSVFFGTFGNQVLAVALDKGEVRWKYEHPERKFPYLSSAAVGADLVVLGGRDKLLHALDAGTGAKRWEYSTRARIDSSPVIAGGRVFIGAGTGEIIALDLAGGKPVWTFDTGSSILASPSLGGDRLVIGTVDGQLYCFGPSAKAPGGARPPATKGP